VGFHDEGKAVEKARGIIKQGEEKIVISFIVAE